ncbi:MAG: hypothetical protein OEM24_03255 [Paracoccaceae bacterium]|nr:hypothetical protein [Paracoccaceae bacterium]
MLVKIITFFLIGMAVLAMFGRLRFPRRRPKADLPPKPRKCPDCGAYVIGKGPCRCKDG